MSDRMPMGGYLAMLPANVRYDDRLSQTAKLLYAELSSLLGADGYCWATNQYFAELYGISTRSVSRHLKLLEDCGYIYTEMGVNGKGSERHIYAGFFPKGQEAGGGMDKSVEGGIDSPVQGGIDKFVYTPTKVDIFNKPDNRTPIPPKGAVVGEAGKKGRKPKAVPEWKPERFEKFWNFYPRGEARAKAVAAWDRLRPDDELIAHMGVALKAQLASEDWQRGIGIPYASTWLNGRRWEDDLTKQPPRRDAPRQASEQTASEQEVVQEWT